MGPGSGACSRRCSRCSKQLLGSTILPFSRVLFGLLALGKDAPLLLAGALLVVLPMAAMLVFTTVALLRLGDWTGPTRRPVGLRPAQLSLPI